MQINRHSIWYRLRAPRVLINLALCHHQPGRGWEPRGPLGPADRHLALHAGIFELPIRLRLSRVVSLRHSPHTSSCSYLTNFPNILSTIFLIYTFIITQAVRDDPSGTG
ncbi:hypothetical protein L226DRAFT_163171 [Lentinus tigrinus ALCF2SS1-7]|uniref:uncharacterized protein n=1 Tax=Lentinus tigrinus ALCF2SS1-7 TaxID=1328758 RepID=UPI0011663E49|nr:hypothetical protein L226DRAFT_163171 [Lentinus tigrinus ALCF2SS1-7]